MSAEPMQPLAVFEEKAIVTGQRLKRTFISTLLFVFLIVVQTVTNILPPALVGILVVVTLFLGLLFFASLMKFMFMRRSRLEIYPHCAVYHRRSKSKEYDWSTIKNFDVQVLREAEDLNMEHAERSAVDTYTLFQRFFQIFVSDPPNYTLNLEFSDDKINMVEISGDYHFFANDLPALIRPIWIDKIQNELASGNKTSLADVTLTPKGIQKKKDIIEWHNIIHEPYQVDGLPHYIFKNSAKEAGFMNANIITQLPAFQGDILISIAQKESGKMTT